MSNQSQKDRGFLFWFVIGALVGALLLVFNVLTEQTITIPLLIVNIGSFHVHHFYVGFACIFLGFFMLKSKLWSPFLLGLGFILVVDDLQDIANMLRGLG